MKTSLSKRYMFVNILHPLLSNFTEIAKFAETRLAKVRDSAIETNCGLTAQAELKLRGQLQALLQELRSLLSADFSAENADRDRVHKLLDIRNTFHYFKTYISNAHVHEDAKECEKLFDRYISDQRIIMEDNMSKANGNTEIFNAAYVVALKAAIYKISVLEGGRSEYYDKRINEAIDTSYTKVLTCNKNGFPNDEVLSELGKLKAWSSVYPDHAKVYEEARSAVENAVNEASSKAAQMRSIPDDVTIEQLAALIQTLDELHKRKLMKYQLEIYGVHSATSSDSMDHLMVELATLATRWGEEATHPSDCNFDLWTSTLPKISLAAERATKLEFLNTELSMLHDFPDLIPKMCDAIGKIKLFLSDGMTILCDDLKADVESFSTDLKEKLSGLHAIVGTTDSLPRQSWKDVGLPYKALIEKMKSALKARFGAIEGSAKHNSMQDGGEEASCFLSLRDNTWFDSLVETPFVQLDCDQLLMLYRGQFQVVIDDSLVHARKLAPASNETIESLKRFHGTVAELKQFDAFWSAIGDDSSKLHKRKHIDFLKKYANALVNQSERWSERWYSHLKDKNFDEARELTETLDRVLNEISTIETLTLFTKMKEAASMAKKRILSTFKRATDYVEAEFARSSNYASQADCLACMAKIQGFPQTDAYLPSFSDMKEKARQIVTKDSSQIEKLLDESADSNNIDASLRDFESACILDPYTGDEATAKLRPLKALRVKRADENEKHLEEMIQNEDFSGMGEFLRPLSISRNVVDKNKYSEYKRRIEKTLKARGGEAQTHLTILSTRDHIKKISAVIKMLEDASKEIKFLFVWGGFNCSCEDSDLRRKLDGIFTTLVKGTLDGCKSRDFFVMSKNGYIASIIFEEASPLLKSDSKSKYKRSIAEIEKLHCCVPKQVETYCASLFKDYGSLGQLLPSLKTASASINPELPEMVRLFKETSNDLFRKITDLLRDMRKHVESTKCYDDGVDILEALENSKLLFLDGYIAEYPFDTGAQLDDWKEKVLARERQDESCNCETERFHHNKLQLEEWKNASFFSKLLTGDLKSYKNLQERLDKEGQRILAEAKCFLREQNWSSLQKSMNSLSLMAQEFSGHLPESVKRKQRLETLIVGSFLHLCKKSVSCLQEVEPEKVNSLVHFQSVFPEVRQCLLRFSFVLDDAEAAKEFHLMAQLVHDILHDGIAALDEAISQHDFCRTRMLVIHNRTVGAYLVDHLLLLKEELKLQGMSKDDMWLSRVSDLGGQHFSEGRDLANIKSCAILGIVPSATADDVKRAYKTKVLEVHPDKRVFVDGADPGEDFRRVKEAHDVLLCDRSREKVTGKILFDSQIRGIPSALHNSILQHLGDHEYDRIELLLSSMVEFELVCSLSSPPLDNSSVRSSIVEAVRSFVHGQKVAVESLWNDRKYKELHYCMSDLKQMESHLKSFPDVFPEAWNRSIVQKVEGEIDSLGQKARCYLRDKTTAVSSADDFRRCFVQMGSVMVELQSFKDYTKSAMSSVLESCLRSDWGYSYLFELGLSFHRGDESLGEDENRVAQTLLSEFSHFKEVMTMVWNEETAQKPVEETVNDIVGEQRGPGVQARPSAVAIDRSGLLNSFYAFDAAYKKLLGEYLGENADKERLARKAIEVAESLKPLCCNSGWDCTVKEKLPLLLAAVFALFTVLKSGESFNRIQKSADGQKIGEKLLMKPHNIQVLTLLHLLGCGKTTADTSLESHLMQIRTGEGKSIILGAAAAMLGLLGFKVRCVCYSEYLSCRDYNLFREVFEHLQLVGLVKYSKITTLSEDTTASKGDIRSLTEALLRSRLALRARNYSLTTDAVDQLQNSLERKVGAEAARPSEAPFQEAQGSDAVSSVGSTGRDLSVSKFCNVDQPQTAVEEILLVDEVDVFFGPEFLGKTYNQVMELREPEIADILQTIWINHVQSGRKQKLADIQALIPYQRLLQKMTSFKSLIDNEIKLMLDQVRRVDEERYYLDAERDIIGYKVHDTISYQATYGYRTVFAYLKEASADNLKDKSSTLDRVLSMPIPCANFSYANISPSRILGVSGTLEAMGEFEKDVLRKYGVDKFFFVPSVYGKSNFIFDIAGDGIFIEESKSDYFQKITEEIQTKTQQKRAVIVFFEDGGRLEEFKRSPFYAKLGRQKALLAENMEASEKEFVINKAATSGQVTLCSAIFGRGTDFFCKDDRVQSGGGVHIIQAFLSLETSEEVQIQGRTSRQGKKGSYQLVLLEDDLQNTFGLAPGAKDSVPMKDRYQWISEARRKKQEKRWEEVSDNLKVATSRDVASHKHFNALLEGNQDLARQLFKDLHSTINKPPIPESIAVDVALLLDATGSMAPYSKPTLSTIRCLINGNNSIICKLKAQFPETEVKLRFGVLGYRDIDDGNNQFCESTWSDGVHFTESLGDALSFADRVTSRASGGKDIAEDHLGAMDRTLCWNGTDDWSSPVKLAVMFTDAPAHGAVPQASVGAPNIDRCPLRHPHGLTSSSIAGSLASKGLNLMICSYNPYATDPFAQELSKEHFDHDLNSEGRETKAISMIPHLFPTSLVGDCPRHVVFVLDESGSMQSDWPGVVKAFHAHISRRTQNQNECDIVSVVQFGSSARVTASRESMGAVASRPLGCGGGGASFAPAAQEGSQPVASTPVSHKPTIVFVSDGGTNDSAAAASTFTALNSQVRQKHGDDLDLHVIAFGGGADTQQLQHVRRSSPRGKLHMSTDTIDLSNIFVNIAGGSQVATVLQEEIGKEISDAVSDALCLGCLS